MNENGDEKQACEGKALQILGNTHVSPEAHLPPRTSNTATTPSTGRNIGGTFEAISNINRLEFERQRRQFNQTGHALDPENAHRIVGQVDEQKALLQDKVARNAKKVKADLADVEYWRGPWASKETQALTGPSAEERANHLHVVAEAARIKVHNAEDGGFKLLPGEERSLFHGKDERDYLGRTYMSAPEEFVEAEDALCFAPKRVVHTWSGHTKGVNAVRLLPGTGHLLLSAAQDARVKLWSVYGDRACLRTFIGHSKPVKDVVFDATGRSFVSVAYDRWLKAWDTETGQCTASIEHRGLLYCARFSPRSADTILAGAQDKRVLQWDLRSRQLVLSYDQHTDAVNTITFLDDDRFMTTSEDRSVRIWECGVPQTQRMLYEPGLPQIPAVALHPSKDFIAMQTFDDSVLTFSIDKWLKQRRTFSGHETLGYSCQLAFSPDGRFLASGDGRGRVFVWDWQNGSVVRKLDGQHEKVAIGVAWIPHQPSCLISSSWDGTIKLWN